MPDDDVLNMLTLRVRTTGADRPCATISDMTDFEREVGLILPTFYKRLLTEVGNGGFGPAYGLLGVPPNGYSDEDVGPNLRDAYLEGRACPELPWRTPRGLIPLCNWGCGVWSYVDCLSDRGAVVTDDLFEDRLEYTETCDALADWMAAWVHGEDLDAAMYRVIGQREGINPFTKQPIAIPIRERIGKRLDLTGRM